MRLGSPNTWRNATPHEQVHPGHLGTVVIRYISFSADALEVLRRVDVIVTAHEDETGEMKEAIRAKLRADPGATLVFLEVKDRRLVCHCVVDGEKAHVSDIEVRN